VQTHVVQRPIGSDGTSLLEVSFLADNSSDTTSRKSSGSSSNQRGELLEELSLFVGGFETKEVGEDTNDSEEFVGGVRLHEREEGGIERIGLFELVGVLTEEEISIVDELAEDQSEDFSEVKTGNHLLERLFPGLVARLVDDDVKLGSSYCQPSHHGDVRRCWCSNESNAPHSHYKSA